MENRIAKVGNHTVEIHGRHAVVQRLARDGGTDLWTVRVQFPAPAGYRETVNGMECVVHGTRTFTVETGDSGMAGALGDDYAGVKFAVEHGTYHPSGDVADALVNLVMDMLEGG